MTNTKQPPIVLTSGEPAGIGPDLCVMLAQQPRDIAIVVLADPELLKQRAQQLELPLQLHEFDPLSDVCLAAGQLTVMPVPLRAPARAGELDPANAAYVLELLKQATSGCLEGRFSAMVTAPLHKGVINEAGIPFTGHTEFLATLTDTRRVVMMLATEGLRVALATTHLPLSEVSSAITMELLEEVITILHHELINRFNIRKPCILVCGLNPHAGESGHLGREEIETIVPLVERLRAQGMDLVGPLPADSLFTPHYLQTADAVLTMYHDQGLPVLKHIGFGKAVNITLGLPIIRTSVDHGTALELAGTGMAETGSLEYAISIAAELLEQPG